MDDIRERVLHGNLVQDVRRLLQGGAADHAAWIRENVRYALRLRREDPGAVSALTGLAAGTVRGFLNGRPSSIDNVLLMAEAVGYTLAKLDRPPDQFRQYVEDRADGTDAGSLGASLLAFEESPVSMALLTFDGTIVKVNRRLRDLLGYDGDDDLIGAPAATFYAGSEADRVAARAELEDAGVTHRRVTELRRKDGSVFSAVTSAVVARDDQGQPRYVIARAALVEPGFQVTPGAVPGDPSA